MVTEVPVQLLGQNVFNYTFSGGGTSGVVIIASGTNTRGVILRTAIITGGSSAPPPPPATPFGLYADFGVGPFGPPPPPPTPGPATTRFILISGSFTGITQLMWPVYLEPTLGLGFGGSSSIPSGTSIYLTWDHDTLTPTP